METTYDYSLTFDLTDIIVFVLIAIMIKMVIDIVRERMRIRRLRRDMEANGNLPCITISGNDDVSISGLVYEGRPIPSVDIKNKALFVDGQFKRRLARNSRVYNRGIGIFADGKYMG
ncbi:hypothetical protein H1O16_gp208 [Burkholderia phage BcepSaruman]|uniref:Uncharacterized protein n=1 Tax=Burkholderia phage BcepSaruman TaxID=2530032 RepID=A0A4D5ZCS8_9CAUD|nr:hypothetical protein H1O16_gp208 [Burkholderia phage BcepSaruman]QBX06621.1 hypothetical protein BcepSaruman_208 [Burkholderia phage BcepSaruman]